MAKDRELDILVAEHVLGHDIIRQKKGAIKERTRQQHIRPLRPYSTDVAACWEVAERMNISLLPIEGHQWFAIVGEAWKSPADFFAYLQKADFIQSGAAVAADLPMAVCIAALKSVEKRTGVRLITPETAPLPESPAANGAEAPSTEKVTEEPAA